MEAGQHQTSNILIVDDEKSVHQAIKEVLTPDEERVSSRKSMKELAGRLFDMPAEMVGAEQGEAAEGLQGRQQDLQGPPRRLQHASVLNRQGEGEPPRGFLLR